MNRTNVATSAGKILKDNKTYAEIVSNDDDEVEADGASLEAVIQGLSDMQLDNTHEHGGTEEAT